MRLVGIAGLGSYLPEKWVPAACADDALDAPG
jgi:hypothetical protein